MPYFMVFHPDFIEFHEIRKPWWLFKKVMFLKFQAQKTQWLVGKRWETEASDAEVVSVIATSRRQAR